MTDKDSAAVSADAQAKQDASSSTTDSSQDMTRAASYPDHLVNGDFSYPNYNTDTQCWNRFSITSPGYDRWHIQFVTNTAGNYKVDYGDCAGWGSYSPSVFGWKNDVAGLTGGSAVTFDLDTVHNNQVGELGIRQADGEMGNGIMYQDIATVPRAVYHWSLKHTSAWNKDTYSMQVLIGAPNKTTAQPATRTASQNGNTIGATSTTMTTPTKGTNAHDLYWDTYAGDYTVPAGQTVTRFTYAAVNGWSDIDDVNFSIAYPLTYNANGGTGQKPTDIANGIGGCQVYHNVGAVTLATGAKDSDCWDASMLTKPGARFLGWSDTLLGTVNTAADWSSAQSHIKTSVTMVSPGVTVYAVWGSDKTLSFDVNTPTGHTAPVTPTAQTVGFNLGTTDQSGWTVGDTTKVPGYKFTGWKTAQSGTPVTGSGGPFDGNTTYDFTTPMMANVVVYAGWQPLAADITYDPNPGDGVVTGTTDPTVGVTDGSATISDSGFARRGFRFNGWNTKADGSGVTYWPGQSYDRLPVGGVTLYAQWATVQYALPFTGGQGIAVSILVAVILLGVAAVFRWWKNRRMAR